MTVPVEEPPESGRAPDLPDATETLARPAIEEICPYLLSSSGTWRSATANRAHRCGAVQPPGLLTTDKQRRLCLTTDHGSCGAFRAARASRAALLAPGLDPAVVAAADAARRPVARTAAVILEHPRLSSPVARWPLDRALSQLGLAALIVVAFVAVALARLSGPADTSTPGPSSPSPSIAASASPTPRPTPRPTPSPSASDSPSNAPSASPSASAPPAAAGPTFRTTYRVQKGDTLNGIAQKFRTTAAAIMSLNGIKDTRSLKIGQILKIP
jgi:LysM repeat protein